MDPDSCLLRWTELCDGITVMPLSLGAAFALLLALALLYTSGFVSASEIAFFSLSPSDLNDIEEENHPSDSKIKALLDDSERLLATILISNNFVNVTIIMLLNYVFASVIDFGETNSGVFDCNGRIDLPAVAVRRNYAENLFGTAHFTLCP